MKNEREFNPVVAGFEIGVREKRAVFRENIRFFRFGNPRSVDWSFAVLNGQSFFLNPAMAANAITRALQSV